MKQLVTICVLVAFTFATFGCYSSHRVLVDERQQIKEPQRIYKIQTTEGRIINFESDPKAYAILSDTTVQIYLGSDSTEVIPISSVQMLYTKGPDPKRTGIAILLGVGVTALIVASLAHGIHVGSWH